MAPLGSSLQVRLQNVQTPAPVSRPARGQSPETAPSRPGGQRYIPALYRRSPDRPGDSHLGPHRADLEVGGTFPRCTAGLQTGPRTVICDCTDADLEVGGTCSSCTAGLQTGPRTVTWDRTGPTWRSAVTREPACGTPVIAGQTPAVRGTDRRDGYGNRVRSVHGCSRAIACIMASATCW
jgi:hypothetical protein